MRPEEDLVAEDRPVATYAQPLSRLQVSWGAILAGAIALLAVSFIVWAFAMAIILSATSATVGSVRGALIAAWVCAIGTTLIGAFIGGALAGYLPGNPRRAITMVHGFLAWAVAFLVSVFMHGAIIGGAARAVTDVAATTASAAVQSAGAAVGGAAAAGAAGAEGALDQRAQSLLRSLGYTPAEATEMVQSARQSAQQILRGEGPAAAQAKAGAAQAGERARGALDTFITWAATYTWLWFATWIASGALAVLGAALVVNRTKRVPESERQGGAEPLHVTTWRPARTTS